MSGLRMAKADIGPRDTAVDQRAAAFHAENPHVYRKLRELARIAKASGATQYGIAGLFERLRWLSQIETQGDPYRLNNSYRAFYARLLMAQEPDLRGFFVTRAEATDPAYRERSTRVTRRHRPPVMPPPAPPRLDGRLF